MLCLRSKSYSGIAAFTLAEVSTANLYVRSDGGFRLYSVERTRESSSIISSSSYFVCSPISTLLRNLTEPRTFKTPSPVAATIS